MTEKLCLACPHRIAPEWSGFGVGPSSQSTSRCRISNRIIRRMNVCPIATPMAKCRCGSEPEVVLRESGFWARCRSCGETTSNCLTAEAARLMWNEQMEEQ